MTGAAMEAGRAREKRSPYSAVSEAREERTVGAMDGVVISG